MIAKDKERYPITLSNQEKKDLKKEAEVTGRSLAGYLRHLVINNPDRLKLYGAKARIKW